MSPVVARLGRPRPHGRSPPLADLLLVVANRRESREAPTMPTALDAPPDTLDAQETNFVAQVRNHGWFRTNVFQDEEGPGFSYTTGFWVHLQAPEIIVFSLTSEIAHAVLWDIYRDVSGGASLQVGQRLPSIFANIEAVLLPVSKTFYSDYLGWDRWFYGGDDWPCVQLVWPDSSGAFPWEPGYEERFLNSQPNLTGAEWPAI